MTRHRWTCAALVVSGVLLTTPGRGQEAGAAAEVSPGVSGASPGPTARLVVVLKGLKSRQGVVRVSLYAGEEGFPSRHQQALRGATEPIDGEEVQVVFEDLAPGTYAVSAFHDEDGDGRLKRGTFGIPKEGIAFSRDARNPVGPPKWKDAKFALPPGETVISCTVRY